VCLDERESDTSGAERAGVTGIGAWPPPLERSGLAVDVHFCQSQLQQAGHPVDVGLDIRDAVASWAASRISAMDPFSNEAAASRTETGFSIMNRNTLYLFIGALAAVAAVVGYLLYQERQKSHGVDINVGNSGISIETK
jgi:hypothetical protein